MRESFTRPGRILPIIIFSQFAGTSLWFAGNAIVDDLQAQFGLSSNAVGYITSAVQLGFISGTLIFAYFSVSDRYSPRKVFFVCCTLGTIANLGLFLVGDFFGILALRYATGFFLAGIYPVGMQIASGWYQKGLGRAIGYLVGALVVGTAFPHLIKSFGGEMAWETIISSISALSFVGGVAILVGVPDGPFLKRSSSFNPLTIFRIFKSARFRAPALGYFGHMWELYSFWAFVPLFLYNYSIAHSEPIPVDISFWSFVIIAAGAIGCVLGGVVSLRKGSAWVAALQLGISGLLCLFSPLLFSLPLPIFLTGLVIWGITVVGDSPQFSTLIAQNAQPELTGTSLTIVNSVGFLLSIPSLQLLGYLANQVDPRYLFLILCIGPAIGMLSIYPGIKSAS